MGGSSFARVYSASLGMSLPKEFIVEALQGLATWSNDPANAAGVAECKAMVAADTSEGKLQAKKGILERMVAVRLQEKPDSRLAPYAADVTPLWESLIVHREDPDVDKLYEQVKSFLG